MLVTLENMKRRTFNLDVSSVVYDSAITRQYGEARVFVPFQHVAFDQLYINPNGGSKIQIDHPGLGRWRGVIQRPSITAEGATLNAMSIAWLLSNRPVNRGRQFVACTSGAIMKQAFADGLQATGYIIPGTFCEASPIVSFYRFDGQTVAEVAADMQDLTSHEWDLDYTNDTEDNEVNVFNWHAPSGAYNALHLAAEGDVTNVRQDVEIDELVQAVTVLGGEDREATRYANENTGNGINLFLRHITIDSDESTPLLLGVLAEQTLSERRTPSRTYTVDLRPTRRSGWGLSSDEDGDEIARGLAGSGDPYALWKLVREGNYVHLHVPFGTLPLSTGVDTEDGIARGLTDSDTIRAVGESVLCRVMSREFGDNREFVTVTLQWLREFDTATLALARNRTFTAFQVPTTNNAIRILRAASR